MRRIAFALLAGVALGCSKPEPPVITPKEAIVASVSLTGVDFLLHVEAFNPNRVDLSARSVTGKVMLDGKYDLGTVTIGQAVSLPAGARTMIDVPLATKWSDLGALAGLAGTNRSVPYTIDGVETVGGEHLNVDVPFHMTGTITHDQLVKATMRSVPGFPMIPLPRDLPR